MNKKWTPEEEQHLTILTDKKETVSNIKIAFKDKLNETGFCVERTERAIKSKLKRMGLPIRYHQGIESTISEIVKKYTATQVRDTIGRLSSHARSDLIKILSISDIHFPLTRVDMLSEILHDHSDADIVVLNGDILEGYMFSTFEKGESISALDEYRCAFAFVKTLSETFPKVVLTSGNHDARVAKALKTAGFSHDATQVLRPDLIARIANGEELDEKGNLVTIHNFKNVIYQQNESWYVRIGKTIFVHPYGMDGGPPGTAVRKQVIRFAYRYGLGEIDSIVCGHTHQLFKSIVNNQLLIEQGCLAGLLKYSWSAKTSYTNNTQNGYALIYQDKDGNTDFNLSGPIYLGQVIPPKKSVI